jgi:branched-chain amino acid transport system substrate-binding protein
MTGTSLRAIVVAALVVVVGCSTKDVAPVVGIGLAGDSRILQNFATRYASLRAVYDTVDTTSGDVQAEVKRATRLVATPGLIGIVGHSDSRSTLAVSSIYREYGIPMVIPSATSRLLQGVPNAFLLAPNDSAEADYMVRFAVDSLRARRAWVLFINDAYGIGLRDGIVSAARRMGVQLVAEQAYGQHSDHQLLLDALRQRGRADVSFVVGRVPDTRILLDLLASRAPTMPVVAADGAGGSLEEMRSLHRRQLPVFITSFWWPLSTDVAHQQFVREWQSLTGAMPGPSDVYRRDAVHLLAAALRDGQRTSAEVSAWLSSLGRTRPPYPGLSGPIAFTPNARRSLVMLQPFVDSIHVAAR